MGNNQPSARKKTYYISLAILAGMVLYIRIRIMGQFHTDSILPYFLQSLPI